MEFRARSNRQNQAIGWLLRKFYSLGDGTGVRFPRTWRLSGKCRVKGNPDGQVFRNKAGEAGRPDLQRRAELLYEEIGSRLDAIDAAFAEDYGFAHRPLITETKGQSLDVVFGGIIGRANFNVIS